jgi:hypothetical protein
MSRICRHIENLIHKSSAQLESDSIDLLSPCRADASPLTARTSHTCSGVTAYGKKSCESITSMVPNMGCGVIDKNHRLGVNS